MYVVHVIYMLHVRSAYDIHVNLHVHDNMFCIACDVLFFPSACHAYVHACLYMWGWYRINGRMCHMLKYAGVTCLLFSVQRSWMGKWEALDVCPYLDISFISSGIVIPLSVTMG